MTRRFIAGAVCPRCGEMDKLVVDSETDQRECVRCGYRDQRPDPGADRAAHPGQSPRAPGRGGNGTRNLMIPPVRSDKGTEP